MMCETLCCLLFGLIWIGIPSLVLWCWINHNATIQKKKLNNEFNLANTKLNHLKEQHTQTEEQAKIEEIIKQLDEINERLEKQNPAKQKEDMIKYIIEKIKHHKKIDLDTYLLILTGLNTDKKDNTDVQTRN